MNHIYGQGIEMTNCPACEADGIISPARQDENGDWTWCERGHAWAIVGPMLYVAHVNDETFRRVVNRFAADAK